VVLTAIARARSWMNDLTEGRVICPQFDPPRLSGLPPDALAGSNSEREAPTTRVALILRDLKQGVGPTTQAETINADTRTAAKLDRARTEVPRALTHRWSAQREFVDVLAGSSGGMHPVLRPARQGCGALF
jgi:hypothetical protein